MVKITANIMHKLAGICCCLPKPKTPFFAVSSLCLGNRVAPKTRSTPPNLAPFDTGSPSHARAVHRARTAMYAPQPRYKYARWPLSCMHACNNYTTHRFSFSTRVYWLSRKRNAAVVVVVACCLPPRPVSPLVHRCAVAGRCRSPGSSTTGGRRRRWARRLGGSGQRRVLPEGGHVRGVCVQPVERHQSSAQAGESAVGIHEAGGGQRKRNGVPPGAARGRARHVPGARVGRADPGI